MQPPRIVQDNLATPNRLYRIDAQATEATMYIYDVIGEWGISARQFVRDFATITADTIHLRINSPGGSVDDARAIAAHLKGSSKHITAHVDGLAASAAAFLTLAADTIEIQDGAFLMVHNPWTFTMGNAEEHDAAAAVLRMYGDAIIKDYVAATGQSEAQIRQWFDAETWFTAAEALDAGLVDAIAAPAEKQPAAARWNLAAFAHAPAALAYQPNPHPNKELNMPLTHPPADSVQAAVQAERTRQDDIRRIGEGLSLPAEMIQNALTTGVRTDDFRVVALEERYRLDQAHQLRGQNSSAHMGTDAADRTRVAFIESLDAKLGYRPAANIDERFRGLQFGPLVGRYHEAMGFHSLGSDKSTVAGSIMAMLRSSGFGGAGVSGAAQPISDFPGLLGDSVGRRLNDVYLAAEAALKRAARQRETPDFRPLTITRLSEYPSLDLTAEGAPYPQGTLSDYASGYGVVTFGRGIGLTRQAIINDDMSAFQQLPVAGGQAAADREASLLVNALVGPAGFGQVLTADSKPIFDVAHVNIAAAGGPIDDTTLSEARLAMRLQKNIGGTQTINAVPKFLVVPAALETAAQRYLAALQPNSAASVNPFAGTLQLIVESRLDAFSSTRWYLMCDPLMTACLEICYLSGMARPRVESEVDFDTDAFKLKVVLDCNVGAVDFRGAYQNPGAVPTP